MILTSTPNQDSDQEVDADAEQSTDVSATYIPNWSEGCVERTVPKSGSPPEQAHFEAETELEHTASCVHVHIRYLNISSLVHLAAIR